MRFENYIMAGQGATTPTHCDMSEKPVLTILFHLLVPGGRWHTVTDKPASVARRASSYFHRRTRDPLLPPPSAQISNSLASGYINAPSPCHQRIQGCQKFRIMLCQWFPAGHPPGERVREAGGLFQFPQPVLSLKLRSHPVMFMIPKQPPSWWINSPKK